MIWINYAGRGSYCVLTQKFQNYKLRTLSAMAESATGKTKWWKNLIYIKALFGTIPRYEAVEVGNRFGEMTYTTDKPAGMCSYCLISAVASLLLLLAAFWHFQATRNPAIKI
jgi:hypothetical protein